MPTFLPQNRVQGWGENWGVGGGGDRWGEGGGSAIYNYQFFGSAWSLPHCISNTLDPSVILNHEPPLKCQGLLSSLWCCPLLRSVCLFVWGMFERHASSEMPPSYIIYSMSSGKRDASRCGRAGTQLTQTMPSDGTPCVLPHRFPKGLVTLIRLLVGKFHPRPWIIRILTRRTPQGASSSFYLLFPLWRGKSLYTTGELPSKPGKLLHCFPPPVPSVFFERRLRVQTPRHQGRVAKP